MQDLLRLTAIRGVGPIRARYLVDFFGSAEEVLRADPRMLLKAGNIGQAILDGRNDPSLIAWAEKEMRFIEDHNIQPLIYGQPGYPTRLVECPDAPVHLFKLGDTPLDNPHIISIVGTRKCTQYGRNIVQQFIRELHELVPDVIVVSGLAYGIDIESHRASLKNDVPTVGVVAHGLDRIYPSQHRLEASTMVRQGGAILTEYPSGTSPERGNFLARNRIIAGLADAVLVAESQSHGGSLVTASIAFDYNREIFAFPGRVGDDKSEGCNRLIRLNRASLVTSAQDFAEAMRWTQRNTRAKAVQQTLNFEEDGVSPLGRRILDTLRDTGDLRLTQLCDLLPDVDRHTISEALLDLEMDEHILLCPGGVYQRKA